MKRKFWNWVRNEGEGVLETERTLFLNGEISDETWYGDEVTPKLFKDELDEGSGNITVWINSPGGDVFAAAQIYNMLRDYKGSVTVKIDGMAASAASVIAMAGDTTLMSPVAMMMIHNPVTIAAGNTGDMAKAIDMLNEVKESILNAYEMKTGMNRVKLSHMMDDETWFNAKKAVELGFADRILFSEEKKKEEEDGTSEPDEGSEPDGPEQSGEDPDEPDEGKKDPFRKKDAIPERSVMFSAKAVEDSYLSKFTNSVISTPSVDMTPVNEMRRRLDLLAH